MTYDGLGNRLEVTTYTDGEGNTTRYVLDGGTTLTEIGADSSAHYLYGLGVIGTLNESWSYILSDGAGSTRQLVDEEGAVNLSVSYTPWGDTLEIYGSGMLNLGYLGGVYDAGTGLIYMGNGQYYDPSTGRFLTRGAQQDQSNPYTPWNSDPAGMLIAPLALLALVFGRKKTRTKFDQFIILFVIVLSVGLSVSACGGKVPEPGTTVTITLPKATITIEVSETSEPEFSGTDEKVDNTPTPPCTETPTPTSTDTLIPTPTLSLGTVFCRDSGCYNGAGMQDMYYFYRDYRDLNGQPGFWNKNGFDEEKFFGLMLMYEMGVVIQAEPYIIAAASLQIWAHVDNEGKPAPYCTGTECRNGMFNFLAAYCESAQRRYDNIFVTKKFSDIDYPTTKYSADEWEKEKAIQYIDDKASYIGSTVLNVPLNSEYRNYSDDKAYHWGNLDGDYSDYIFRHLNFYVLSASQRSKISEKPIVVP